MKTVISFLVLISLIYVPPSIAGDSTKKVRLFMADGQLSSHPIKVFLTKKIQNATLRFISGDTFLKTDEGAQITMPLVVAGHNQQWPLSIAGEKILLNGTLLIFNSAKFSTPVYKVFTRVTPIISWKEGKGRQEQEFTAIGEKPVYLGNIWGAMLWTGVLILGVIGLILWSVKKIKGNYSFLFCDPVSGKLSLWRTQLNLWLVAIGSMVTWFGLTRLTVPDIPETIVAIMGLASATGGISYVLRTTPKNAGNPSYPYPPKFSDLICDSSSDDNLGELSIARAQMVFWTFLIAALFIVKSFLDEQLWEIPWAMVALIGMSQAGYLGAKSYKEKPKTRTKKIKEKLSQ